ncbi:MAG: CapA family protein [Dehalococcoidia bacterium]
MKQRVLAAVAAMLVLGCSQGGGAVTVATVGDATEEPDSTTAIATADNADQANPTATTAEVPENRSVTLAAVGDVMLARSIGQLVLDEGATAVFQGVREELLDADITFANVESAISDRGTPGQKGYTFEAPPETIAALVDAGIDIVAQANNHALDFGPAALLDTRARLEGAGIAVAGSGNNEAEARRPALLERWGVTFAFLAYVDTAAEGSYSQANWDATDERPGVAWASIEEIVADVTSATAVAGVVVVSLHVGVEYSTTPSDLQRMYAEAAIDAGASLVLGHHAHVLQPVEEYNGGLIAYSLGNFVFDGFDGSSNVTAILRVTFEEGRVSDWGLIPVSIAGGVPILD